MNDRDEKYEGQEEGEYQFSDEHTAYEVDTETTKMADVAVVKESPLANLSRYKRLFIVIGVFFTLMFIIYKLLGSGNGPGDISQQATSPTSPTSKSQVAANTVATPSSSPAVVPPTPTVASAPAPTPQVVTPAQPAVVTQPSAPVPTMASPSVEQVSTTVTQTAPSMNSPTLPGNVQYETGGKELIERIAALEQQNAKMANVMQIEYAQKLADAQTQEAATQAKLKELTNKVASMETALTQIVQILQGSGKQVSVSSGGGNIPSAKSSAPKQIYSVQAIIPGRAWLKSDAGDTVTVAEGDLLRDYGRVTKIDPYDGIVSIDTGSRVISLSYGSGSD